MQSPGFGRPSAPIGNQLLARQYSTELDASLAPGIRRAPPHADSIAITDWSMDSHDCTTDRRPGFAYDGKLILTEESRPAQIPYRCLLPQGIDNLLIPVCLSATHVAWGAVRLEPVWMQTGEAAGWAAVLAKRHGIPFYVAAPLSTFDPKIRDGSRIPIEERPAAEVTGYRDRRWAPEGVRVRNPAFDVTPAELITGIITERGVVKKPNKKKIQALISSSV
jgi:hypothetical protein